MLDSELLCMSPMPWQGHVRSSLLERTEQTKQESMASPDNIVLQLAGWSGFLAAGLLPYREILHKYVRVLGVGSLHAGSCSTHGTSCIQNLPNPKP